MSAARARRAAKQPRRRGIGTPPGTLAVPPGARAPSMHVIAYGPDRFGELDIRGVEEAAALRGEWPVVWLDVVGLGDEQVLLAVGEAFGVHRLALEDVVHVPQRPKADLYGQTLFIVCQMLSLAEALEIEQLSLFVTDGAVVTFQERPGDCLDPVRDRIRAGLGRIRDGGADYLAYALLDAVIDHQFPVLEQVGERLEALEDEVLDHAPVDVVAKGREAKRDLLTLRRIAWPQRDAINRLLHEETPLIQPDTQPYLRDAYDHLSRVIDTIETHRELASDLMNIHLTVLSNQMNAVMKTLTVLAAIFIPLTFIAGLYGMNFENMPELRWPWAYPAVLAIMGAVAAGMLLYFRRKRWL